MYLNQNDIKAVYNDDANMRIIMMRCPFVNIRSNLFFSFRRTAIRSLVRPLDDDDDGDIILMIVMIMMMVMF